MASETLIANVRKDEQSPETLLVASPVVAMADGIPKVGLFLNPLDRITTLTVHNRRFALRLPRDVSGHVVETLIPNALTPVAYGDSLARLDPRVLAGGSDSSGGSVSGAGGADNARSSDLVIVEAPSDGVFYRRPSPDSPPFVEVGSPVVTGGMLGMVEIMKCFHHITYGGDGLPESGEIIEILAEDASEVRFGQALFHLKPTE